MLKASWHKNATRSFNAFFIGRGENYFWETFLIRGKVSEPTLQPTPMQRLPPLIILTLKTYKFSYWYYIQYLPFKTQRHRHPTISKAACGVQLGGNHDGLRPRVPHLQLPPTHAKYRRVGQDSVSDTVRKNTIILG